MRPASSIGVALDTIPQRQRAHLFESTPMNKTIHRTDRVSGIYYIKNITDGKNTTYVGSSCLSVYNRTVKHISLLRRGKSHNKHLQNAWNKYGEDSFEFGVLERGVTKENVVAREQYWLDWVLARSIPIYNKSEITVTPLIGYKHTEETREKIKVARAKQDHGTFARTYTDEDRRITAEGVKRAWKRGDFDVLSHPYPDLINVFSGHIKFGGDSQKGFCEEFDVCESEFSIMVRGISKHCYGWMPIDRFLEMEDSEIAKIKWYKRALYNNGDKSHAVIKGI